MEDLMDKLTSKYLANKGAAGEGPVMLDSLRAAGFESFQKLGLPDRTDDEWKFSSLRDIRELDFSFNESPGDAPCSGLDAHLELDDINLVFINGALSLERSNLENLPDGLQIIPLRDAFDSQLEAVEALIQARNPSKINGLLALNQAFLKEGLFIRVDKDTQISRPLHILYADGDEPTSCAVCPRILVELEDSSGLTILESTVGSKSRNFINAVSNIHLRRNSRLHHYKIQASSENAVYFDQTMTLQEKDSFYESFCLGLGGKLARTSLQVHLAGEGAEAVLNGAYLTKGSQQIDQYLLVDHQVGNSRSTQFYKGILDNQSRAVFNGKVVVREGAQKAEAKQKNSNLMLSDEAEVDTQPQLEIRADDIKCSHGATIGQLRRDELFYLQTRGITKKDAVLLLGRAFIEEAVLKINDIKMQRRVMKNITNVLPKVN